MSYVVGGEGISAEEAGEWLIDRLKDEARRTGSTISEADLAMLRTPVWNMDEFDRSEMIDLNNRAVALARGAIDHAKAQGVSCDQVRKGLRIPSDWRVRYQIIFMTELPWLLSGILQNALMNNPMAGERRKWKSK